MKHFIIKTISTIAVIVLLLTFVIGIHHVKDNNMFPMMKDGDLAITYKLTKYNSGDVVLYKVNGEMKLGRIIAVEDNIVDISNNEVFVNGNLISEDIFYPTPGDGTVMDFPLRVEPGTYFILNDYRSDYMDGRTYGCISKSDLKGEMLFLIRRRSF